MLNLTPSEKKTIFITLFVLSLATLVQFFKSGVLKKEIYDYSEMDSIFIRRSYLDPDSLIAGNKNGQNMTRPDDIKNKSYTNQSININRASRAELEKIPYIGPVIAQRIIEYRAEHKFFRNLQDLKKVKGIGEKTFQKIEPFITLD